MSDLTGLFPNMTERQHEVAAEIAAHPERQALANLFTALALIAYAVLITVGFCIPAAVWWVYHAAT